MSLSECDGEVFTNTHLDKGRPNRKRVRFDLRGKRLDDKRHSPRPQLLLTFRRPMLNTYDRAIVHQCVEKSEASDTVHTAKKASQKFCGTTLLILVRILEKLLDNILKRLERFVLQDLYYRSGNDTVSLPSCDSLCYAARTN